MKRYLKFAALLCGLTVPKTIKGDLVDYVLSLKQTEP